MKQGLNSVEARVAPGDTAGSSGPDGAGMGGGGTGASAAQSSRQPRAFYWKKLNVYTSDPAPLFRPEILTSASAGSGPEAAGAQANAGQTQGGPQCRPCTQHQPLAWARPEMKGHSN